MADVVNKLKTQTVQVVKAGGRKAAAPGILWIPLGMLIALVGVGLYAGKSTFEQLVLPIAIVATIVGGRYLLRGSSNDERDSYTNRL